jgi:hypothetical protein
LSHPPSPQKDTVYETLGSIALSSGEDNPGKIQRHLKVRPIFIINP